MSCNLESEWTGRYQQSAIDLLQEPCYCSSVVQDWHPALMKETKQCIAIREAASQHWQEGKKKKTEGERKDKIQEESFGKRCKNFLLLYLWECVYYERVSRKMDCMVLSPRSPLLYVHQGIRPWRCCRGPVAQRRRVENASLPQAASALGLTLIEKKASWEHVCIYIKGRNPSSGISF